MAESSSSSSSEIYSSSSSVDSSSSTSSFSSSSSSTSSMLSSSTSSMSSSSSSSSSPSSQSLSSSSSQSSDSSSSSSSIDSSSESSESVGNVSSSSSSSFEEWNKLKPLILGTSSVTAVGIDNRLAQTITVRTAAYGIGKVFCYFYGPFGDLSAVTFNLSLYSCNDDGSPDSLIVTRILAGSNITANGWYFFDFSLDGVTPANDLLSFVFWQDGGDEDNYALWGYAAREVDYAASPPDHSSWFSDDSTTWTQQIAVTRSLKVTGDFDAFDLVDFRVLTPPAEIICQTHALGGTPSGDVSGSGSVAVPGTDGTPGSEGTGSGISIIEVHGGTNLTLTDGYNPTTVGINHQRALVSFVIDASGSMGWNDRFDSRIEIAQDMIDRIKTSYPRSYLFDIVKFGSRSAVANDVVSTNIGIPMTINLDLNSPTRTTYLFAVDSVNATKDAIYSTNTVSYTISNTIVPTDNILVAVGAPTPPDVGTLTKVSGTGDATIEYSSVTEVNISDMIIAYGFKNLEQDHTYNLGDIKINNVVFDPAKATNWQTFLPAGGGVPITEDANGPNGTAAVSFTSETGLVLRKPPIVTELSVTNILIDVAKNAEEVFLDDPAVVGISRLVDLVDIDSVSTGHAIAVSNVSASSIDISPQSKFSISSTTGIVQESNASSGVIITGTTAMLLVRDINVTRDVIFYLQTLDGYIIEWDFTPHDQWYMHNLFYHDLTAVLPMEFEDEDGDPFVDGSKIILYVDELPAFSTNRDEKTVHDLTEDSLIGSNKIYVASTSDFSIDDEIDLLNDSGDIQRVTVTEVNSDVNGPYLLVSPVLLYNFTVADGAKLVKVDTSSQVNSLASNVISDVTLLPAFIMMADSTPIYAGEALDPSVTRPPYDPTPVDPSASYDSFLTDRDRIKFNINDIPTINGFAQIRVLPITEDNLKTKKEKEEEAARLLLLSPVIQPVNQLEQNEDDFEDALPTTTTTTTVSMASGVDYVIENPVFTRGGSATSTMTTYATNLSSTLFAGLTVPGVTSPAIFVRPYTIYPTLTIENDEGEDVSVQVFDPFQIYFTPSIALYGEYDGGTITEICAKPTECDKFDGYEEKSERGEYAGVDGFSMEYTVTNKGELVTNADLTIRIYSNPLFVDIEELVCLNNLSGYESPTVMSSSYLKVVTPSQNTLIDQWRLEVGNNTLGEMVDLLAEMDEAGVGALHESQLDELDSIRQTILARLDAQGVTGAELAYEDGVAPPVARFYTNPWEWIPATQYGNSQEQTVTVINGKATVNIPASDVSTLLFIEASLTFRDNIEFEAIKADFVPIANPIRVSGISPERFNPSGGDNLYEIGTKVTFLGGVIDDDVTVSFSPSSTDAVPSVSRTENGWAGGVQLGPHQPVTMICNEDEASDCFESCHGVFESINITVSHLGYTRSSSRTIEWIGELPGGTGSGGGRADLVGFFVNVTGSGWGDGEPDTTVTLFSDLGNDALNYGIGMLGAEGIETLSSGNADGSASLIVYDSSDRIGSYGMTLVTEQETWVTSSPGVASAHVYGLNRNLGYEQTPLPISGNCPVDHPPWDLFVTIMSDGEGVHAMGLTGLPYSSGEVDSDGKPIMCFPRPVIENREPLGITVTLEALDSTFLRNGTHSPYLVAEVTWRGEYIDGTYTKNRGALDETVIDFPFPDVVFIAGTSGISNSFAFPAAEERADAFKDTRNIRTGVLDTINHLDVGLTTYSAKVSISRTDINEDGGDSHTHACIVDSDGNGETTETIVLAGTVADHTHTIASYVTSTALSHTHGLRSVALTRLNPTTNGDVDIAVNGYVRYDPTVADPFVHTQYLEESVIQELCDKIPIYCDSNVLGNRMMFHTFYDLSSISDRRLIFTLDVPTNVYTALSVSDGDRAFNITATAKFSEYTYVDSNGNFATIPEAFVDDGTRIIFQIDSFKPMTAFNTDNIMVIDPDVIKDYMVIRVRATIYADDLISVKEKFIRVVSNRYWLPYVDGLFIEPSNDDVDISTALAEIDSIGSSQIHDAVKMAAQRIIQFQVDNEIWEDAAKVIFLITDGDENTSEFSLNQAIQNVGFINGTCEVPVVPIRLGSSYHSDELILQRYASETCGDVFYMLDATSLEIDEVLNDIIIGTSTGLNDGTYTVTIDLGNGTDGIDAVIGSIGSSLSFSGTLIPSGTRILFRVRFSDDLVNWSTWSDWFDSSLGYNFEESLESKGRYFQYEAHFFGNEVFDSPQLLAGATLCYYDKQSYTIFFEPVDMDINSDEFVSSIAITHHATIPATSNVTYGFANFNTVEEVDYFSATRSELSPDRHTILLTRYNELFLVDDLKTYRSINGRWPQGVDFEVYRINDVFQSGVKVDFSEYASNYSVGSITFNNTQPIGDSFVLKLSLDSVFRLICKVNNYGSDTVSIDHIGILYNVTKRVPKDADGNIINIPINQRIT